MKKFGQILALAFMLAFGYGLGQQGGILWATDYPGGGGTSDHTISSSNTLTNKSIDLDSNTIAGTIAEFNTAVSDGDFLFNADGTNGIHNVDAADESIQRLITDDITTSGSASTLYGGQAAVTYGTAYTATPVVLVGAATEAGIDFLTSGRSVTTTTFTISAFGDTASTAVSNISWLALGNI